MKITQRVTPPPVVPNKQSQAPVVDPDDPHSDAPAAMDQVVRVGGKDMPVSPASLGIKVSAGICAAAGTVAAANMISQIASAPTTEGILLNTAIAAASGVVGYLGADLISGFFHHAIDNYPKPDTPILGNLASDFLGHHYFANSMEKLTVLGNLHPTAPALAPVLVGLAALNPHYAVTAGALSAMGGMIFGQASHRWTHQVDPPGFVKFLRKAGIAQEADDHRTHHRAPWTGNYCIINGALNPLLDKSGFWRKYENVVHKITGAEPKAWQHPAVKDYAQGKISKQEMEARFKAEIPIFKKNIGFEQEREYCRQVLTEELQGDPKQRYREMMDQSSN